MKRILLVLTTCAALGLVSGVDVAAADSEVLRPTEQQTATFVVDKMSCALCPITVRKAMERVEGVKSVSIDLGAKTATVVFDPAVTTAQQIAKASENAGYPARPTS